MLKVDLLAFVPCEWEDVSKSFFREGLSLAFISLRKTQVRNYTFFDDY